MSNICIYVYEIFVLFLPFIYSVCVSMDIIMLVLDLCEWGYN